MLISNQFRATIRIRSTIWQLPTISWTKSMLKSKRNSIRLSMIMMKLENILKLNFQSRRPEFKISKSKSLQLVYNIRNMQLAWHPRWKWLQWHLSEKLNKNRGHKTSLKKKRKNSIIYLIQKISRSTIWWKRCIEWRKCMRMNLKFSEIKRKTWEIWWMPLKTK